MNRAGVVGVVAYVVLVASLATPLSAPLPAGRDDSWALVVVLVAAHLGARFAVRRAWMLVLPVAFAVTGFVLVGAEGLARLVLLWKHRC